MQYGYWVVLAEDGSVSSLNATWVKDSIWVEGASADALLTSQLVEGQWLPLDTQPKTMQLNIETLDEMSKILGVEFEGVMCSATKEDQDGLAAVLLAIQLQGANFQPTLFHFSNGSKLPIDLSNYQALVSTWLPFRQSFFKVQQNAD